MIRAFTLVCALWLQPALADPVVVFAAASLKEPIDALAAEIGDVVVSYGGSGGLARQITAGAPADVVLLANVAWMDALEAQSLVTEVHDFAGNQLVVLGPRTAPDLDLATLPLALGQGRLAIGAVGSVPAGIYAKSALVNLGLWDQLKDHLAEVDNVRAGVVLLARGEVPFAVSYATDAGASDAVRIVAAFPETSHDPIRYLGGIVSESDAARAFWEALQGPRGQALLRDAGFTQGGQP